MARLSEFSTKHAQSSQSLAAHEQQRAKSHSAAPDSQRSHAQSPLSRMPSRHGGSPAKWQQLVPGAQQIGGPESTAHAQPPSASDSDSDSEPASPPHPNSHAHASTGRKVVGAVTGWIRAAKSVRLNRARGDACGAGTRQGETK